jgi:hypothetical protein
MSRELLPEEEDKLSRIESIVSEILRALHGEPMYKQKGLLDQFDVFKAEVNLKLVDYNLRLASLESGKQKWLFGAICFGIGVAVAIGIFFGLSLKEIKAIIKP